jgi:hypothetical protein
MAMVKTSLTKLAHHRITASLGNKVPERAPEEAEVPGIPRCVI